MMESCPSFLRFGLGPFSKRTSQLRIIRVPNTYVLGLVWNVYLVSNSYLSRYDVHSLTRGRSVHVYKMFF